ncbi:MAG TPA: SRPBCC domain-containing protein [Bacteroidia bacterium]|jgi:uncharacterized protein YndB with AHSA1/START domain|nr:SRPBCC domain-containing protein [Bacteroidia bacterium]
MELKTKINAEDGKQDLTITREFDLPVELLFKAHAEPELIEQWMTNPYATAKMLKFEGKKHGSYQQQSTDANGNVVFKANGAIHEFIPNKRITRTFEMENAPLGVQLEIYDFEKLSDNTSKLTMHVIYESGVLRDQVLKMPFAQGLSMAHNRMQEIMSKLK